MKSLQESKNELLPEILQYFLTLFASSQATLFHMQQTIQVL